MFLCQARRRFTSRRRFSHSKLKQLECFNSFQLKLFSTETFLTQRIWIQTSDSFRHGWLNSRKDFHWGFAFLSLSDQRMSKALRPYVTKNSIIVRFHFSFLQEEKFFVSLSKARSHNGDNGWVWEVRSIAFLNILSLLSIIQTQKVLLRSEGTEGGWYMSRRVHHCNFAHRSWFPLTRNKSLY